MFLSRGPGCLAYPLTAGPKDLLTPVSCEHVLGGVAGYDGAETTNVNPEVVAVV
jgi:hypothetical protein